MKNKIHKRDESKAALAKLGEVNGLHRRGYRSLIHPAPLLQLTMRALETSVK